MYAMVEACGRQYKVQEGDVVFFEKLDAEEGKKINWKDGIHAILTLIKFRFMD